MYRIIIAALALAGCDDIVGDFCTEIGCTDGFTVELDKSSWDEGDYTVEVDVDGDLITCTATIPLDDSGGCDDDRVMLGLSGSELPVEDQALSQVYLEDTDAAEVGITILLDGNELASEVFEPDYEELMPNGEECPPTCTFASDTFAL